MTRRELIKLAGEAREQAYAPYSGFKVGAALLTKDDRVFTGANVENASYALTVCAERVAVAKAVSEGRREFTEIAVMADCDGICPPCGACLQTLCEFSPDMTVTMATVSGRVDSVPLADLYPKPFKSFRHHAGSDLPT